MNILNVYSKNLFICNAKKYSKISVGQLRSETIDCLSDDQVKLSFQRIDARKGYVFLCNSR